MADSIRGKIKNVGAYPAAVEIFCFDGFGLFYAQGRARCIAAKAAPGPRGRVGADRSPLTHFEIMPWLRAVDYTLICICLWKNG
ncbi:MAG: hypothetical protein LIP11_13175 [Clostridiales bacterium]|nr:hypothetical protein [Clostridiales bacterium]